MPVSTLDLRRASIAVFLACDEEPARHISRMLEESANEVDRLRDVLRIMGSMPNETWATFARRELEGLSVLSDDSKEFPMLMKSRQIVSHKVNGINDAIVIDVPEQDGGPGGAPTHYVLSWPDPTDPTVKRILNIDFQNGGIAEAGTNGVTHEVLAALIIDRIEHFQKGPFACRENALAITKFQEGLMWLKFRTEARLARGVEGKVTP